MGKYLCITYEGNIAVSSKKSDSTDEFLKDAKVYSLREFLESVELTSMEKEFLTMLVNDVKRNYSSYFEVSREVVGEDHENNGVKIYYYMVGDKTYSSLDEASAAASKLLSVNLTEAEQLLSDGDPFGDEIKHYFVKGISRHYNEVKKDVYDNYIKYNRQNIKHICKPMSLGQLKQMAKKCSKGR